MAISTSQGLVQRFAMGLYGVQLGNATMTAVLEEVKTIGGITKVDGLFNWYYAVSFGAKPVADVAATLVANLGIVTGQNGLTAGFVTFAKDYIAGVLNAAAPEARGAAVSKIISAWENLSANAEVGAAVKAWQAGTTYALNYANVANTPDMAVGTVVSTFNLSAGNDIRTGTAGNDMFVANFAVEGNTLNSGDVINGGAGNDQIKAIMATQSFSTTPTVNGVETITITAQSDAATDSGQNNVSGKDAVQLDFGRVSGIKTIENFDSRADLIVEDVRIASNEITKDITIVMRDTDPGHVDFGVYFDQNSLRNTTNSTSQINLQVMDTRSVVDGTAPLLNSPYGGFRFTATDSNGAAQVITLQSAAIDNAQTYAQLQAAFQAAADAQFGAGVATVTIGSNFTVTDTTTGNQVTGQEIVIKAGGSYTFTTPAGSGWIANGVVPANSGLHTNFNQNSSSATDLVTSKIVLDNVGRGSTGGDLVVGGLSVGDTSDSKGVQRFEITVEDNSRVQTINSTANSLREVTIVNGTTTLASDAYRTTVKDAGNLTVNGLVNNAATGSAALPGISGGGVAGGASQHNAFGFSDVRLIDASTFKGQLAYTAELTETVVAKYMTRVDSALNAAADNVTFDYKGGLNNDTMSFTISDANLAAAGTTTREDFVLSIAGGAGNDVITTTINAGVVGEGTAWYSNSKLNANLSIDAGDGNDTVRTIGAGDFKINLGAGNDTVYTDNSGTDATAANSGRAVWVFNTSDQTAAVSPAARLFTNLVSDTNESYALYGSTMTVNFKGLTSAVTLTDAYKYSDLQINQKIKLAINGDATLSKLLVAEDGPANTLVVRSLIDGTLTTANLAVTVAAPAALTMSAAQIAEFNTANALTATSAPVAAATAADVVAIVTGAAKGVGLFNANADYATQFANEGAAADVDGAASTATGDNVVTVGTGNDVVVLSTNATSSETIVFGAGTGNDVIVNFTVGAIGAGNAGDLLDFKGLGGATGAGFNNAVGAAGVVVTAAAAVDKSVVIDDLVAPGVGVAAVAGTHNNTAALVANLFQDAGNAAGVVQKTYVYVAVDTATNIGTVYSVVDAVGGTLAATTVVGGSNVTATVVGSIDLADTLWATVAAANIA